MPTAFRKRDLKLDIKPLQDELLRHPEYFGEYSERYAHPMSPHRESTDIWFRFNDVAPFERGEKDFSTFCDEHESVWYDVAHKVPIIKDMAAEVMNEVGGTELGGVLLTKLPAGKRIYPHVDSGTLSITTSSTFPS